MAQAFALSAQCLDFASMIPLGMQIESPVQLFASLHMRYVAAPFPFAAFN